MHSVKHCLTGTFGNWDHTPESPVLKSHLLGAAHKLLPLLLKDGPSGEVGDHYSAGDGTSVVRGTGGGAAELTVGSPTAEGFPEEVTPKLAESGDYQNSNMPLRPAPHFSLDK